MLNRTEHVMRMSEVQEGRVCFGKTGIDGRIILNLVYAKKQTIRTWTRFNWVRIWSSGGARVQWKVGYLLISWANFSRFSRKALLHEANEVSSEDIHHIEFLAYCLHCHWQIWCIVHRRRKRRWRLFRSSTSTSRLIRISLLHIVVKRVRNSNTR